MRILIVEDERKSAAYLQKGLGENGFVVDVARDGEAGLHLARTGNYALVVLDVMLPQRDGFSVLQELRHGGSETPVLVLSARDAVRRSGARPRARRRRLLGEALRLLGIVGSRPIVAEARIVASGGTAARRRPRARRDPPPRRAGGAPPGAHPKEFSLLALLARRAGEALSRTLIAEEVWDMNSDSETNVVDVHVRRLRSKVDDPFDRKLIHTVRGVGYVLEERPER